MHPQRSDVRDVASISEAVSAIVAAHGRIDVLVNNAGLGFARAAFDVTPADWDEMMAVNLRGVFFMSQAVARTMAAAGRGGRIVNISSQGGVVGLPDAAVYCASKGGVNMLTKTLALEWAKYAITVNAIAPTFIYTPGTAPILDEPAMRAVRAGQDPARPVRADRRCGRRDHLPRLGCRPDGHRHGSRRRRRVDFTMSATIRLTAEGCAATFDPADGGRLTSFRVGGHELLVAHGRDVFHFGSFVMAPWVGRLRDARLNYGGAEHRFTANSGPHALHGLVTNRPWRVTGDGELSIELGDPWPWPCRVVQRIELSAGRAAFRIEVHARVDMPAAVGWHPWFVRRLAGTPASAELELDVEPGLMWANDATGLPSGELTAPAPRPWDYCFRELQRRPGRALAGRARTHRRLRLRGLGHL